MTILAKLWSQTEWGSPSDSETDPHYVLQPILLYGLSEVKGYHQNLSNQSMVLIEKASNMAKSGGTCFPKVCILSYNKIGQPKPSRICIIFDLKLWKIIFIIFRPFWPEVSKLSFVSVSLLLDVTKIATIYSNYSLASGILRNILKACWPRCACGRLSRTKQQICHWLEQCRFCRVCVRLCLCIELE